MHRRWTEQDLAAVRNRTTGIRAPQINGRNTRPLTDITLRGTGVRDLRRKYGNKPITHGDLEFASQAEGRRYLELKLLEHAESIQYLRVHPAYAIVVNGHDICKYVADFEYVDVSTGSIVVEDVKSKATKTPVYRLKKRLMFAVFGITITEVM